MSSLIKQVLIALLRFSEYLASDQTKCLFLNDEPHMLRSTLTEMNPVERKYYRFIISLNKPTQQEDVVATFFCPSQRRRKYVSNETPNDVSVVSHQYVSVVTSLRNVVTTPQEYVTMTYHWYVSTTSQTSLK